jgi:hypothetical protein
MSSPKQQTPKGKNPKGKDNTSLPLETIASAKTQAL